MQTIYIIDEENELIMELREIFANQKSIRFVQIKTDEIDMALKEIPSLIIINEDSINDSAENICDSIKQNDDNGITPIIVLSSNT